MVKPGRDEWLPRIGERVNVAWGLEAVSGTVVEAYASGSRARAVVRIDAGQVSDLEETLSVPLDALEPVEQDSDWARGASFESAVINGLRSALADAPVSIVSHSSAQAEVDALIRVEDRGPIVVEIKFYPRPPSAQAAKSAWATLQHKLAMFQGSAGLLIVNRNFPAGWDIPLGPPIRFVVWRNHDDDIPLRESLAGLGVPI
jgi:hypothetical protein